MLINNSPPAETVKATSWVGKEVQSSITLEEVLEVNPDRIKILIDNRSNDDCFYAFGDDPNLMRLMPDNIWIESEAAHLNLKLKGSGLIFIAEWLK